MGTRPIVWMSAASVICWTVVSLIAGSDKIGAAFLGMLGPLAGAVATWMILQRAHARAPERTSGVMIKLFAAKLVLFGAYVGAVLSSRPPWAMVFVVSFTSQYIVLHFMEAVFLRRLFAPVEQS
jgi:hypothetical protein